MTFTEIILILVVMELTVSFSYCLQALWCDFAVPKNADGTVSLSAFVFFFCFIFFHLYNTS